MFTQRRVEIDTEKLINAVKIRPELYDKTHPNYCIFGKKYKGQYWKDVCRDVIEDWDKLTRAERVVCDAELQKRWRNLRTCFTRELKLQSKGASTRDPRTRRPYAYFNQMKFLVDSSKYSLKPDEKLPEKTATGDPDSSNDTRLEIEIKREDYEMIEEDEVEEVDFTDQQERTEPVKAFEDKIIGVVDEIRREQEDEDKQFALSLVPSLRNLSTRQKFDAKIEILKVLQKITFQDPLN